MQTITTAWSGQRLTLGDLRRFLAEIGPKAIDTVPVTVSVAPTSNMPTDPGGEIRLSVTREEH